MRSEELPNDGASTVGEGLEELSKSVIWHTTPMQQRSKSRLICDWLSATALLPSHFRYIPSKCDANEILP